MAVHRAAIVVLYRLMKVNESANKILTTLSIP